MIPNVTLLLCAGVLVACGVYLLLARSIVRALIGFLLLSNGVNLLFLVASGPAGDVPVIGEGQGDQIADPVPQALMLTAIVITLAMTSFVLALAHRHWQVTGSDLVVDDPESQRIHHKAEADDLSEEQTPQEAVESIAEEFAEEDPGGEGRDRE